MFQKSGNLKSDMGDKLNTESTCIYTDKLFKKQ